MLIPLEKTENKVKPENPVQLDFKDHVVFQATVADLVHQDPQVPVDLMEPPDKLDPQDLLETVDPQVSLEHLAQREKLAQLVQEDLKDHKEPVVNLVPQDPLDHQV